MHLVGTVQQLVEAEAPNEVVVHDACIERPLVNDFAVDSHFERYLQRSHLLSRTGQRQGQLTVALLIDSGRPRRLDSQTSRDARQNGLDNDALAADSLQVGHDDVGRALDILLDVAAQLGLRHLEYAGILTYGDLQRLLRAALAQIHHSLAGVARITLGSYVQILIIGSVTDARYARGGLDTVGRQSEPVATGRDLSLPPAVVTHRYLRGRTVGIGQIHLIGVSLDHVCRIVVRSTADRQQRCRSEQH